MKHIRSIVAVLLVAVLLCGCGAGVKMEELTGKWEMVSQSPEEEVAYMLDTMDLYAEERALVDMSSLKNVLIAEFGPDGSYSFTYDAEKNGYLGTNWDLAWSDANTGEVAPFQNLLILDAPTQVGADIKWHSVIKLVDQEGKGYYCNGGAYEPITWKRGALEEPFRYYDAEGNELELGIGRTYIGIISLAHGGVTFG